MNTFLPVADFKECALILDGPRLRNQRRECLSLLSGGWRNHPCAKMWAPYDEALRLYLVAICEEVISRGWQDNVLKSLKYNPDWAEDPSVIPEWLGDERLHSSHRANLLRKNPVYYEQFGWTEKPREGYYWPVAPE